MSIADRIAVLHEGWLRQCGRPEDVDQRPVRRSVTVLIGEMNFLAGRVARCETDGVRIDTDIGTVVAAAGPPAATPGASVTLLLRRRLCRWQASVRPASTALMAGR